MEPMLRVVVFWRLDSSRVKYEWAPVKWEIEGHLNNSHEKLAATITRLLKSSESFAYEAYVTVKICIRNENLTLLMQFLGFTG